MPWCSYPHQSCWHILLTILRLLSLEHTLHPMGDRGTLLFCLCLPAGRADKCSWEVHKGTNSINNKILSEKLLDDRTLVGQPCFRYLQSGTIKNMKMFVFERYPFWFALFGWVITLYPIAIICWQMRREWEGWDKLKLSFAELEINAKWFYKLNHWL